MTTTHRAVAALLAGAALAGCMSMAEQTDVDTVTCPRGSTLTYDNLGAPFVAEHCLGCHTTEAPVLTSQAQLVASSAAILDDAVYTTAMPADAAVSDDERALFGEWLACGAP